MSPQRRPELAGCKAVEIRETKLGTRESLGRNKCGGQFDLLSLIDLATSLNPQLLSCQVFQDEIDSRSRVVQPMWVMLESRLHDDVNRAAELFVAILDQD